MFKFFKSIFSPIPPDEFAKRLAKAQLNPFQSVRKRFPTLEKEEAYEKVIAKRIGYDKLEARAVIEEAKTNSRIFKIPFNLRSIASVMAKEEYSKYASRMGGVVAGSDEINQAVDSVIPKEL